MTTGAASPPHFPRYDGQRSVIATFDTGTNPFHPCWRNGDVLPYHPIHFGKELATPLALSFSGNYSENVGESKSAVNSISDRILYTIPGTRLLFFGDHGAKTQFIDQFPHGAQASSQLGCREFGFAPQDVLVLVLNFYTLSYADMIYTIDWIAQQSWIDIVHYNVQDVPVPAPGLFQIDQAIGRTVASGKLVIVAAGNGANGLGANYPMELSRFTGPPGSLVIGACDQSDWLWYSNLNPHVVMDGEGTIAAAPFGYGNTTFSGTSSSSPRAAGYAAALLARAKREYRGAALDGNGTTSWIFSKPPSSGPMGDGVLTAPEFHMVIRRTADPFLGPSKWDGPGGSGILPSPARSVYQKVGYGKLTELTMEAAWAAISGTEQTPLRASADQFYAVSEALRERIWSD